MVLSSVDIFFKISFVCCCCFLNHLLRISVVSQAVWVQIMLNDLFGLIWVQIVCKGYQQTTLVSKEFMTTIQAN